MKNLIKTGVIILALTLTNPGSSLFSEQSENLHLHNFTNDTFNLDDALESSWQRNYEEVLEFIKQHEGFANGRAYRCAAGNLTIGYGHIIRKGEHFPHQLTKEQADSLLRADFRQAIRTAEKLTGLKGSRKLAVAHFIFSKGCGAFSRSTLLKEIKLNGDTDREFMRWCYYTKPGTKEKVKSKVAERISRWECKMWHQDDNLYAWGRYFN